MKNRQSQVTCLLASRCELRGQFLKTGLAIVCLAAIGCSAEGAGGTGENGTVPNEGGGPKFTDVPEAGQPITAPPLGEWATLLTQSWDLEPGDEGYWCRRVTVAEDIWVSGFRAISPVGTHHMTLGKDSGGPDGTFRCGGFSTGSELLFGSGAVAGDDSSDAVVFSEGLAVKLSAGEQLLLNVHAFNTGVAPVSELSGIQVLGVDSADVEHDVAFVLAGLAGGLEVLPGQTTQTGRCTVPAEITILSVGAHMHTQGIHQRVTAFPTADSPVVLTDAAYDFEAQAGVWLTPAQVIPAGGYVEVVCTYQNDTGKTLTFGESTDNEMCYAGLYHYPRFQPGSTCVR